ncbi:MAG: 1,4-dihydroxy-6-naphthoate synthase [Actinomycetia bacterium]|nr:1,4-dihydroxy-6-naphthoate synthase [Actinomycetes bacterium]
MRGQAPEQRSPGAGASKEGRKPGAVVERRAFEPPLRLAYSPCPNDTFIFRAWVQGLLPGAPAVEERLEDIDTLNLMALQNRADVIKVSIYAFAHLRDPYALLHSGGALGRGCGPLIVGKKDGRLRPAPSLQRVAVLADELAHARVAIPGGLTTAALLAGLLTGGLRHPVVMPFDRIMPAVVAGEVEAGVVIHEGRFTFGSYGLRRLLDLGEWWEETSGLPIPLGGIAVSRSLDRGLQGEIEQAVRSSVEHARADPEGAMDYVRRHSQEMDPLVCRRHIDLYVNDFTSDYGEEGKRAIGALLEAASALHIVPGSEKGLFWDE